MRRLYAFLGSVLLVSVGCGDSGTSGTSGTGTGGGSSTASGQPQTTLEVTSYRYISSTADDPDYLGSRGPDELWLLTTVHLTNRSGDALPIDPTLFRARDPQGIETPAEPLSSKRVKGCQTGGFASDGSDVSCEVFFKVPMQYASTAMAYGGLSGVEAPFETVSPGQCLADCDYCGTILAVVSPNCCPPGTCLTYCQERCPNGGFFQMMDCMSVDSGNLSCDGSGIQYTGTCGCGG
jgi:hypothetical protein